MRLDPAGFERSQENLLTDAAGRGDLIELPQDVIVCCGWDGGAVAREERGS